METTRKTVGWTISVTAPVRNATAGYKTTTAGIFLGSLDDAQAYVASENAWSRGDRFSSEAPRFSVGIPVWATGHNCECQCRGRNHGAANG